MKKIKENEWLSGTVIHDRLGSGIWKGHYTQVRLDEPLYKHYLVGGEVEVADVHLMWSATTSDVRIAGRQAHFLPSAINVGPNKAVDILYRK